MKSAKSPTESLSTRASRAWGALGRSRVPAVLLEVIGAGLNCLVTLGDLGDEVGMSTGGLERSADNLVTDDECDRPLSGRGPSFVFEMTGTP